MTASNRIAFIGNSLPRRCGIATFTTDLQNAVAASRGDLETVIVAMTDHGQIYDYPSTVGFQINDNSPEDYIRAAEFLNNGRFDAVSLQHEFGIFGGEAGSHILALLSRLTIPVVTTLHTVLSEPTKAQRDVLVRIIEYFVARGGHGRKRPRAAAGRLSGAGRKDRDHSARNS